VNLLAFKVKEFSLIHSILFAIFPGIVLYAVNRSSVPFEGFILPILLVVSFVIIIWVILRFILKNSKKAGFIVTSFFFIILMSFHIVNIISGNEIISLTKTHFVVIALIIFGLSTYYFVRTKRKLDNATKITNGIAIALLLIVLVNIGMFQWEKNSSLEALGTFEKEVTVSTNDNPPDVYYFMLDGHTNQLVAEKFLEYDDKEFIKFLNEKGFYVPSHYTYSNYLWTQVTVPAILNMNYVDKIVEGYENSEPPKWILYELVDRNQVMKNFKSMGYTVINFDSGWWSTKIIENADANLCTNLVIDYALLRQIKETTLLPSIKVVDDLLYSQKRNQILCELDQVKTVRERFDGPLFVFAHIVAPHSPFVFDANGKMPKEFVPKVGEEAYSELVEERRSGYLDQMKFIDNEMQKIIEKLLADTEREKIIIIQSDHGPRIISDERTEDESKVIRIGNFNAYYLPSKSGEELFSEHFTNVNTFRIIFNSYFNGNYEILEDVVIMDDDEVKNWKDIVNSVFPT